VWRESWFALVVDLRVIDDLVYVVGGDSFAGGVGGGGVWEGADGVGDAVAGRRWWGDLAVGEDE
jgi:hypothetical protein